MNTVQDIFATQTAAQRAVGAKWLAAFQVYAAPRVQAAYAAVIAEVAAYEKEQG